jgi:hypothetical protein
VTRNLTCSGWVRDPPPITDRLGAGIYFPIQQESDIEHIEKIGIESLDTAFYLLQRFFSEEGFDTPAEKM